MAKKVSLINMKGGVGKSTLAVNLAWHFVSFEENKVLVIDLDPQFNASQYLLGVNAYERILEEEEPTIWNVFEQFTTTPGAKETAALDPEDLLNEVVEFRDGSRIDLIPSQLELAYSMRNPGQKEQLLQKTIAKIEDDYDLIIMDCAPTESLLTTAAYLTSDYILVPVKPEYLSSIGLPLLVRSLQDFKQRFEHHKVELAGVVFNGCSDYSPEELKAKRSVKAIAKENDWYVFKKEVSFSRSYPKGAREGKPIFSTSYSRSNVAANFRAFAEEFAERIGL